MNEKWLEIYKKYRERKYKRDLDKLQANFAERGLIQSGIREREEQWLKEDYEDEVAMPHIRTMTTQRALVRYDQSPNDCSL